MMERYSNFATQQLWYVEIMILHPQLCSPKLVSVRCRYSQTQKDWFQFPDFIFNVDHGIMQSAFKSPPVQKCLRVHVLPSPG